MNLINIQAGHRVHYFFLSPCHAGHAFLVFLPSNNNSHVFAAAATVGLLGQPKMNYAFGKVVFFLLCPCDTPNSGNDATHLAPGSLLVSGKEVVFFSETGKTSLAELVN